jgi:phosphoribosyl 1,2-cyclic phosphodiesterase
MRIRFWGTRGSLPVALEAREVRAKVQRALERALSPQFAAGLTTPAAIERFVDSVLAFEEGGTFGGNSACVQVLPEGSEEIVVCDAGSGLRTLGQRLLEERGPSGHVVNLLVSHVHWDHIMGFPFFTPAYVPGNTIRILGCHDVLESAFRGQQSAPCFPVSFNALRADIEFVRLEPGRTVELAGLAVTPKLQRHGGDSYGYRFEQHGKAVIYSTDGEHKLDDGAAIEAVIEFFRGADLVVFDAMYSLAEAISVKEDWGHSSNLVGVDLCLRAGVGHYCMFHHEPIYDDETLARILAETRRYEELSRLDRPLEVSTAYDGLEIEI